MVEYLDPEIAGEGLHADASWTPAVPEARIPDYKGIKSIAKYFPQFTGRPYVHKVFPCWFYHKEKPAVLVQDIYTNEEHPRLIRKATDHAKELGCVFRKSTGEEIAQGFPQHRWEYTGEWRATPFHSRFDPAHPGPGKTYVKEKAGETNQAELIASIVAAVVAKIGAPQTSGAVQDADHAEFEAFKAWKAAAMAREAPVTTPANALHIATDDEKARALAEADRLGVKVDRRLGADKILAELAKVV